MVDTKYPYPFSKNHENIERHFPAEVGANYAHLYVTCLHQYNLSKIRPSVITTVQEQLTVIR